MTIAASVIEFNDLLVKSGLNPASVFIMRHRPTEKALRDVLPWLAEESHDVYNAYQSQHGSKTEVALSKAKYLASFIGHEPGRAIFVGIYLVHGFERITAEQFWKIPHNLTLHGLGTRGPGDEIDALWFDLRLSDELRSMKGRLVIEWTGIERSWWRWADRNVFPVLAIHDENQLVPRFPDWRSLVLSWQELQALPRSWRHVLGSMARRVPHIRQGHRQELRRFSLRCRKCTRSMDRLCGYRPRWQSLVEGM